MPNVENEIADTVGAVQSAVSLYILDTGIKYNIIETCKLLVAAMHSRQGPYLCI